MNLMTRIKNVFKKTPVLPVAKTKLGSSLEFFNNACWATRSQYIETRDKRRFRPFRQSL